MTIEQHPNFIDPETDRFIKPSVGPQNDASSDEGRRGVEEKTGNGGSGGGGGDGPDLSDFHPFVQGLLKTLPQPETEWPAADRVKWLQTAANIFDLIYKGDGGIKVESAAANRSPRPGEAQANM